jgi:putative endopeptidase
MPQQAGWGFDLSAIDKNADPREDFFRYANGKWLDETPIPPDQPLWGIFDILRKETRERLRAILEELRGRTDLAEGSEVKKLRDLYASGLDTDRRNREGASPLVVEFTRISAIANFDDFTAAVARLRLVGARPLWLEDVDQNPKANTVMSLFLLQGGLGLPDREYYFAEDKVEIRAKYRAHVRRMFELLGDSSGAADITSGIIMEIETELAGASWKRSRMRDIPAQCNYFTLEGLEDLVPAINWRTYFELCGVDTSQPFIVGQPGFFAKLAEMLKRLPMEAWQMYLKWKLIASAAPFLSQDFSDESFDFNGRVLSGQQEQKPLWERCVMATDLLMGEALGKLYVERHFGPEAKAKMLELVANIVASFEERVRGLSWMTEATKAKAVEKLHAITWKIGAPDRWCDYSGLKIGDVYVLNVLAGRKFNARRQLAMVAKPVDPTIWHVSPQTVNGYANPMLVEMVFPAGILQAPFFDPEADDAVNYGAIGAAIAHELIHHFDDQGRRFDAHGNLNDWWAPEDGAMPSRSSPQGLLRSSTATNSTART